MSFPNWTKRKKATTSTTISAELCAVLRPRWPHADGLASQLVAHTSGGGEFHLGQHQRGLRFFSKVTISIFPARKLNLPPDVEGSRRNALAGRALEKIMCASAIAWAGFREVWVLFGAETMTGDFDMPVDMKMYRDIFGVSGVKEVNSFYRKYELKREAAQTPEAAALAGKISHLEEEYGRLEVKDFQYPGM